MTRMEIAIETHKNLEEACKNDPELEYNMSKGKICEWESDGEVRSITIIPHVGNVGMGVEMKRAGKRTALFALTLKGAAVLHDGLRQMISEMLEEGHNDHKGR